jgi:hypothetical protein
VIGATPINITGTPPADTVIINNSSLGLEVILNQQIPDLAETAGITTNAIAIEFSGFLFGMNGINGDIDIASSSASVTVPEPATGAEMLTGFAFVGCLMRGRLKAKTVAQA